MALGDPSPPREIGSPAPHGSSQPVQFTRHLGVVSDAAATPWALEVEGDAGSPGFELDLLQYWHTIWKRRFLILAAIASCLVVAAAVTLLATPIYTAQTTIQIDRKIAKVVNIQDVEPREEVGQSEEFYQTQYGLLKSRALVERVTDTLGLASSPTFLHATGLDRFSAHTSDSARGAKLFREAVLKRVTSSLGVNPVRGSRLVTLTFDSPDPNVAAQVANSFADSFIATDLERRFESSSYARDFLEKQLALAKTRLEDSERAAVAYAIDQQIINLHDADTASDPNATEPLVEMNLAALDTAYANAQAARIAAQSKWNQAQASAGLGLPEILQSPTIQDLSQDKAKLESQYQDQLRLFKPGYPAMQQLKAQIDEINSRIQSEAATIRDSLKENYSAALKQEQSLKGQVDTLKASDLDLKNRSIRYNFLQREVDTNRALYDGLLQRYKEVGVTGGVAANNVSIVDRAESPLKPSKPQPAFDMALALVIGMGLGVLAAFGVEALDQAIRNPGDIEAKLGVPFSGRRSPADEGRNAAGGDEGRALGVLGGPLLRPHGVAVLHVDGCAAEPGRGQRPAGRGQVNDRAGPRREPRQAGRQDAARRCGSKTTLLAHAPCSGAGTWPQQLPYRRRLI